MLLVPVATVVTVGITDISGASSSISFSIIYTLLVLVLFPASSIAS